MDTAESQDLSPSVKSERLVSFLMLGKTGSGKTTLINAFVNHFNKKKFSDKKQVLIPQKPGQVCSFPDLEIAADENETSEGKYGQSRTQECIFYKIKNDERAMLIIDTPGMGDTRGFDKDDENIKKIIDTIKKNQEAIFLQAIIFVTGNECKSDTLFKYYVDEIKKVMTKPCLNQTIVICTKKDGKFPAETKKIITDSLGDQLPDDRWFTFENSPLIEEFDESDEDQTLEMKLKWNKGAKTFEQIFERAAQFEKIPTQDMEDLFQKRRQIEEEIDKRIKIIGATKKAKEDLMKYKQDKQDIEKDTSNFLNEESKEKHERKVHMTNFNCLECNETCISDTNRLGYVLKSVLTLSAYHWISEKSLCAKCKHSNSKHVYEDSMRFTGLDEMGKKILEQIRKDAWEKDKKRLTEEQIAQQLEIKIDSNMEEISQLSLEIERLGVISVTYNSYIAYLDYLIEIEKKKANPMTSELQSLERRKKKYEEYKSQLNN